MLVLTRRRGEKLILGDDVTLTVTGHRSRSVTLRVQAPAGTEVRLVGERGPSGEGRTLACDGGVMVTIDTTCALRVGPHTSVHVVPTPCGLPRIGVRAPRSVRVMRQELLAA